MWLLKKIKIIIRTCVKIGKSHASLNPFLANCSAVVSRFDLWPLRVFGSSGPLPPPYHWRQAVYGGQVKKKKRNFATIGYFVHSPRGNSDQVFSSFFEDRIRQLFFCWSNGWLKYLLLTSLMSLSQCCRKNTLCKKDYRIGEFPLGMISLWLSWGEIKWWRRHTIFTTLFSKKGIGGRYLFGGREGSCPFYRRRLPQMILG